MEISGEQHVDAPRQRVWEALNDPLILKECILGCEELERLSDTEMKSIVMAKFGPVKARFKTLITIEDIDVARSYSLVGNGQGGVAGFAKGVAAITLSDSNSSDNNSSDNNQGTLLQYSVDFSVGGKLAQIGSRLLKSSITKYVDHFFATFLTRV